ncbi:MAG TPA: glycosyltransferase 87 family protein [Anaerolineae bacterium]|nr:glycosyltransferase 87 family protein [Anaerolineae bacterium]
MNTLRTFSPKIAFVVFLLIQTAALAWTARNPRAIDFAVYYLTAHALQNGSNIYTLTDAEWTALAEQYRVHEATRPYLYPPLTAGVVGTFASLPYPQALLVWTILSVMATTLSGFALSRLTSGRWIDPVVFGALAVYVPILTTLYAGQVNTFVLLGLAFYLYRSQGLIASGSALAASLLLKPIAAPLLAHLLWRRDLRRLMAVVASLIVLAIGMTLLVGLPSSIAYVENAFQLSTLSTDASPEAYPPNQSLLGFFGRVLTAHNYGPSLTHNPPLARLLWLGCAGLLLLGVAFLTWPRGKRGDATLGLETGLVLVTINLIVPISWYHHAVISIIPLVLAWRASPTNRMRAWLVAAFVLINVQGLLWHWFVGHTLLLSLGTYGLLIIYAITGACLFSIRRQQARADLAERTPPDQIVSGTRA